jgi:hypothetical protein
MTEQKSISQMTNQQDEFLLSNIPNKYRPFAKRLLTQYSNDHPFYVIAKQYRNDTMKLKEEINKALDNRNAYALYILNEFRSIK